MASTFQFSKAKAPLIELAIKFVFGGLRLGKSEMPDVASDEYKKLDNLAASNREEVCSQAFSALDIPRDAWGPSVEPRALSILGRSDPWEVTIATLTSNSEAIRLFGTAGTADSRTRILDLSIECAIDLKAGRDKGETVMKPVQVEIGRAGTYDIWRSFGLRGLKVLSAPDTGYRQLTVILDQNPHAWDYQDSEWQEFSQLCGMEYLTEQLHRDLDNDEKRRIKIEHFCTQPIHPLDRVDRVQSASGVKIHYLVSGVTFDTPEVTEECDDAGGLGLIPCPALDLMGAFPLGLVSEDGLTPITGEVNVRISFPSMSGPPVYRDDMVWPPSAVHEAKEGGDEGAWRSARSYRRRNLRQRSKAKAHHSTADDADTMVYSDTEAAGGSSSQPMARGFGRAPAGGKGGKAAAKGGGKAKRGWASDSDDGAGSVASSTSSKMAKRLGHALILPKP